MLGLAIIDMQNWMFRLPERASQIPALVANVNIVADAFAARGLPVFVVDTVHQADRSTWTRLMRKYDFSCLIEGTDGAQHVDGLRCPEVARTVVKTRNNAFLATDFEAVLKEAGITEIALAGVFMDGCVGLTAADAAQRGFGVTFIDDAIGHSRIERRNTIMSWLVEAYELSTCTTDQMVRQLREQVSSSLQ
jgi:nicotinamidase-related amidase